MRSNSIQSTTGIEKIVSVCHLTTVHARADTRIFIKQCCSLAENNYSVSLVVADGRGDGVFNDVSIHDVGLPPNRLQRFFVSSIRLYRCARRINADIYHIHDPELIPIGLLLLLRRNVVIFDAHEDLPLQVLSKPYLNPLLARLISKVCMLFERLVCPYFSGIVAATPCIRSKFLQINKNTVDINNYPKLAELGDSTAWRHKCDEFCYIGRISSVRGVRELIKACEYLSGCAVLNLAGDFIEPDVEQEVKSYPGWRRVKEFGYLDRKGVRDILRRSKVGIVTLHPIPNYIDSLPVKMFEYMAAGIPVVASNFPLFRQIVEENNCGLCVDPLDPQAIASAVDKLLSDPLLAASMGRNGQGATMRLYNWDVELRKLLSFYRGVIA